MEWLASGIAGAIIGVVGYWWWQREHQQDLSQASETIEEQAQRIDTLEATLAEREETIEGLEQEMARADSLILKLRQNIAQDDSTITNLQKRVDEYERIIAELREKIQASQHESRQSKALFSTISGIAYDMVFVLDEDSTIISLNRSADDFFGTDYRPIGESFADVVTAPDLEDIVSRAMNEDESLEEQFKIGNRYYRARTQVMRYGEEDQTFIGVAMQDITQLVRLNRARRDMVANISHELSTPIANIRLIIDSLFHDQSRPKRKASIASLRQIAEETESLQWTVQELLDLSMIESGQAIMKLVEEPLADIAEEAIDRLEDQLDKKNINVVIHIPEKMRVLCDREHVRRVFVNLISNAIKWSPPNDAVTVSAHNGGEEVTVSVFDNGPGVPEDQRERVFERFYQVDTARSGESGSGLGLAICKHIIEAHGGSIWAEGNAQGGGGRFLFTLLNARAETTPDDVYMDRGQHDVILQQSPVASDQPVMPERVRTSRITPPDGLLEGDVDRAGGQQTNNDSTEASAD